MWVFSADWKRSEGIECQAWAHFSGEWINSNTLRVKGEFHALLTFPDTVIYMGPAWVSADLSVFPEETSPHFPPVTPRRAGGTPGCLLLHPAAQAGRTMVLDPALKSDPALKPDQPAQAVLPSISECFQGWTRPSLHRKPAGDAWSWTAEGLTQFWLSADDPVVGCSYQNRVLIKIETALSYLNSTDPQKSATLVQFLCQIM